MHRSIQLTLLALTTAVAGLSDTLRLRDGRVLTGRWLGGEAHVIRFDTGGREQMFVISSVEGVSFGPATEGTVSAPANLAAGGQSGAPGARVRPAIVATVAGVLDGVTYINKGSAAGLKHGQSLQVYRAASSPGRFICTLVLSDVEETSADGGCNGETPRRLDTAELSQQSAGQESDLPAFTTPLDGPVYEVGDDVTKPSIRQRFDPEYSEQARKAKLSGVVELAIVVGSDGHVHNIRVLRGLGMGLDEKAIEAIGKWLFVPAKKNGTPVDSGALVSFTFRMG